MLIAWTLDSIFSSGGAGRRICLDGSWRQRFLPCFGRVDLDMRDPITAGRNGREVVVDLSENTYGERRIPNPSRPTYLGSYLQDLTRLVLVLEILPIPQRCFEQISNPHATSQHVKTALLSFAHLTIIKQRVSDRADSASVTYGVIHLVVLGEGEIVVEKNCGMRGRGKRRRMKS